MTTSITLERGVATLGLRVPAQAIDHLLRYLELIDKWNQTYNLTAIRDPDRMIVEHLLDSLSVAAFIHPTRLLDIGSGAGLPGVPLAIVRPEWQVTLLDSNHKKATFLRQAVIELGLANVEVVCERVERFQEHEFDTVISRAFAETQQFAKVALPVCADQGLMLAMKGLYPHEELAQLPAGVTLKEVRPIVVPGLAARRHLVIMTKA